MITDCCEKHYKTKLRNMSTNEDSKFDYNVLEIDKVFIGKCENLKESLAKLQIVIDNCKTQRQYYDEFSECDKVEFDLFTAFACTSLYWVYLRIQGIDLTNHPIKNELDKIKNAVMRWEVLKDAKKRPKVNKDAAKRFIQHGLWDHKTVDATTNKKIQFED